ncbi:MAG TPA: hypothetical protein VFV83_03960 [Chthoniobacteraceae bacterium]|nr:hypothetical protein [Chthoniobacteraceae bacterium]
MTNEDLKNIWAQQGAGNRSILIAPESVWRLARKSERFESTIFWRDVREWAGTAFVAGIFLFYAFSRPKIHWLPVVAAILACAPMTYVAVFRRKRPEGEISGRLTDYLQDSIARVRHQIRLLRSVLWWYLAPLALSMMLIHADAAASGRVHFDGRLVLSAVVAVAIFFVVWKLNQRAVRTDLEPRLHELEKTLAELET